MRRRWWWDEGGCVVGGDRFRSAMGTGRAPRLLVCKSEEVKKEKDANCNPKSKTPHIALCTTTSQVHCFLFETRAKTRHARLAQTGTHIDAQHAQKTHNTHWTALLLLSITRQQQAAEDKHPFLSQERNAPPLDFFSASPMMKGQTRNGGASPPSSSPPSRPTGSRRHWLATHTDIHIQTHKR
jgi:hypothetical protein